MFINHLTAHFPHHSKKKKNVRSFTEEEMWPVLQGYLAVLSQSSSTSHVSKCSRAESCRAPAALVLSTDIHPEHSTRPHPSWRWGSKLLFSVPLWIVSLFISTFWSGRLEMEFLTVHLEWEKRTGLEIVKGRSLAETGPWESFRLWCHNINPELRTHTFCRFILAWLSSN